MDKLLDVGLHPTYDQFDKELLIPNSKDPKLGALVNENMKKFY